MGLVFLDISFQVEKAFKIRMPQNLGERLGIRTAEDDATLARFHLLILELCAEQGVRPPADSWRCLAEIIESTTGMLKVQESNTLREVAPDG